jgi:hypothetical protein
VFAANPKEYLELYNKTDQFEYLGLEFICAGKRGKGKREHFKMLVKEKIIKEVVEARIKEDEFYIPVSGKIISYAQFFGYICKGYGDGSKKDAAIEKEKRKKARDNTMEQLKKMEEESLKQALKQYESEKSELDKKRDEIEKAEMDRKEKEMQSSENCSNGFLSMSIELIIAAGYLNIKEALDFRRAELNNLYLAKKTSIIDNYNVLKNFREEFEINRAALLERKNARKRERRAMLKKDKRMRIDNNLDSLSSNDTKKSLSSDEDPSDFDDMESDIGDGIEDPIDNSSSSLI